MMKVAQLEVHNLYASSNVIRQITSRRMRWEGHVACIGKERKLYKVLVGKPQRKDHSEDPGVGRRKGLEWMSGRFVGGCGVDLPGSESGPVAGSCEHGDETLDFGATELVILYWTRRFISLLVKAPH
jgi:hypothetical protein